MATMVPVSIALSVRVGGAPLAIRVRQRRAARQGLRRGVGELSTSARTRAKRAARTLVARLSESGHERAAEVVGELLG